jgi:hypothetical protein
MTKFDNPLNNLKVASPCSQDWDTMVGDNRKRYCGECKLNVFNLSGMPKVEAENLIMNAEGRLCVRFYKRADGSVITEDCPVGWAKVKQRTKVYVTAFASLIFSFFSAIGLATALNKSDEDVMGDIATSSTPRRKPTPKNTPQKTMGIMVPTPKQTPTPKEQPLMGKIAAPKQNQQMEMGDVLIRKN